MSIWADARSARSGPRKQADNATRGINNDFVFMVLVLGFSEPPRQVQLDNVVVFDRVQQRQVEIVAARAQVVVDDIGMPVTDRADDGIGEAVSEGGVKTLEVGAAFEKVRVHQIHVQGVLLDMLPVKPALPGVLL